MDDFQTKFLQELVSCYGIPSDYLDAYLGQFPTCSPGRNEITGNVRYWDEPIECPNWPIRETMEITLC